jgi:hypothetical protein
VSAEKAGFEASAAGDHKIIAAKDADGTWVYLVRREALAEAVPDPTRLDGALRLIAARDGLRPSRKEGTLTRQKPAVGGKLRFVFFTPAFARPAPRG